MMFLLLPFGLLPTTLIGWLILRLLEGRTPVLRPLERWTIGCILGLTVSLFWVFLIHVGTGILLTRMGFVEIFALLLIPLVAAFWWLRTRWPTPLLTSVPDSRTKPWARGTLIALSAWTAVTILAGVFLLICTPSYFDDTTDNWNLRAKIFYTHAEMRLILPPDTTIAGVSSYPPTVSLSKTWLAAMAGQWDEGLINSIHAVWYLGALVLLYCFLRRSTARGPALLGTYLLASLPLYLVHGLNAYADVFVSVHLFCALFLLTRAMSAADGKSAASWLRLTSLAIALLPFTKNEALILYLPPMILLLLICLWRLHRTRLLSAKEILGIVGLQALLLLTVLGPWLGYKWMNGLSFGNAKSIESFEFGWQPGVSLAVTVNTFFEGNWLLFFPLLLLLLVLRWRSAFSWPLFTLTAYTLVVYVGQLILYLFTSLSTEALLQTGYARGLIHLMPAFVALAGLLLAELLSEDNHRYS